MNFQIGSVTGFAQSIASISRMITPLLAGLSQEISIYGPGIIGTSAAAMGSILAGYMSRKYLKEKEKAE